MTDETTERLLDRARTGDREAFDVLCRQHSEHLTTLVHRQLGAELGAKLEPEDILQETFLRAWQRIHRYDSRWKFSTWLFTIGKRLTVSRYRRARHVTLGDDVLVAGLE